MMKILGATRCRFGKVAASNKKAPKHRFGAFFQVVTAVGGQSLCEQGLRSVHRAHSDP